jgi:hypothetical protein
VRGLKIQTIVLMAVDNEGLRDVTTGDSESVEGVGCMDVHADTVGLCEMANETEDRL